jgi:hypothetical protein
MRVRRRPTAADARPAGCAVVLLAFSVVFAVIAIPALPGPGAVLYLLAGLAGALLCAAVLTVLAGQAMSGRAVLELDERGVRLPAPWPWPRSRDRVLAWPDVAAVVVWSGQVSRGRSGVADRLAFLPTTRCAERTGPPRSPEILALGVAGLPGVATAQWSIEAVPGWDVGLDEVVAEVRDRGGTVTDVRSRRTP